MDACTYYSHGLIAGEYAICTEMVRDYFLNDVISAKVEVSNRGVSIEQAPVECKNSLHSTASRGASVGKGPTQHSLGPKANWL